MNEVPPESPDEYLVRFTATPQGRMRSRTLDGPRDPPPVVTVQGMAVSEYLLPALTVLSGWTQAHLVDLPGLAGRGDYCGVDRAVYPQDFASNVRFHHALAARRAGPAMPHPAPWEWVRQCLQQLDVPGASYRTEDGG